MALPTAQARTRWKLVRTLDSALDKPMIALAFVWLVLLVLDLVYGLSPAAELASDAIWGLFLAEFALKLWLAPNRLKFLVRNWLTALSLLLPALRVLRFMRFARALSTARGIQVVRIVGTVNRGMRALAESMGRRGFGYVGLLTVVVAIGGAAGMYAFERGVPSGGFRSYWDALWWTAMSLTTAGAPYTPVSAEGRVLAFLLALYAFSVFGYVAAALASFFVDETPERQTRPRPIKSNSTRFSPNCGRSGANDWTPIPGRSTGLKTGPSTVNQWR